MSRRFIALMVGLFIIVVGAFFLTLRWGSELPLAGNAPAIPGGPAAAIAKSPSVTLTVTTSQKGNTLVIRWENLPDGTVALDIFRSTKGKNDWSLWKTIPISPGDLAGGMAEIGVGNSTLNAYSFYIEAMAGGGNGPVTGSSTTSGGNVLWGSPITEVPVSTSTPGITPPPPGPGPENPPPPPLPSSTPSSSAPQNPIPSSTNSSTPGNGNPPGSNPPAPVPSGTPYYTPQLQISGYGTWQGGSFWVRHVDQKIEIGWQDLPPITTSIMVFRSSDEAGPWNLILTQGNPGASASSSYSIQLVDDTLGSPYYYRMDALAGNSSAAAYGPVYLPPVGQ